MMLGLVGADDPELQGLRNGRPDLGVIVTQQRRAMRHAQIYVLAAVQIVNIWPFAS
jgi:hypothetical protein